MVVLILLLVCGIPAIIVLALMVRQRARLLTERIAQVQDEMARDPRPPYAALAALMQEQEQEQRHPQKQDRS